MKIIKKAWQPLCLAVILIVCLILRLTGSLTSNEMRYLLQIFLYITLGEMWNLMSGFGGMTSLGQQAFIGLAGYSAAAATTLYKLTLAPSAAIGAGVCTAAAVILGLLLLHMRGMYFSIATWVAAEALGTFFSSWKFIGQGAGMNVTLRPYPQVGELYLYALILCAAALGAVYLLLGSKPGTGLKAMRDDISAAASLGVDVGKHKFIVYMIAAVFTALAGELFFVNKGTIYPESGFGISWTISVVFIVIIGGVGTVEGPVIGAVIYVLLNEYLAHFPGWSNIILGIISIVMIIFMPEGIVGSIRKIAGKIKIYKANNNFK